ncbi:MAG: tRNA pseudouridine(38-40) synthase TruA [Pseudomonadota bacterium]
MEQPRQPQRIALCVEYDGSVFNGWQTQLNPRLSTVQETLELALSTIAAQPIKVHCAGRTDTGVHAAGQIVHFDVTNRRTIKAWVQGTNSRLPKQVAVRWAREVSDDFHARFSATSRRYRYIIANTPVRPALQADFVTPYFYPLDAHRMHTAAQLLLGENDFTSYRAVACQSRTPMRNLIELSVVRLGDYVVLEVEANAFLLHMVRNLVGVLLAIGDGRKPPEWAHEVLEQRDRSSAGVTAPPTGLCLIAVRYPEYFNLPTTASAADFFSVLTGMNK